MNVNIKSNFKRNWMIWTNSILYSIWRIIMESEISITISVDFTHILDIICIIILLQLFV